jgi:hypothetical protein
MAHGHGFGKAEPGRTDRGGVQVCTGEHSASHWGLSKEDRVDLHRGEHDGARGDDGDDELTSEGSELDTDLRSGRN